MVTREFRCTAHDYEFEAEMEMESRETPECPYGCSKKFVVLEFRTPHSIRSGGTHTQDVLMRQLAQDYGLTDMRNTDGQSVMQSTTVGSGGLKRSYQPFQLPKWEPSLFAPEQGWARRAADDQGHVPQGAIPKFNHPDTMPGKKTGIQPIIDARPPDSLRAKTVFQKPK